MHHYILLILWRRKEESPSFSYIICIHLILSFASSPVINKNKKNIFAKNIFLSAFEIVRSAEAEPCFLSERLPLEVLFQALQTPRMWPNVHGLFLFFPSLPAPPLPPASLIFSSCASPCVAWSCSFSDATPFRRRLSCDNSVDDAQRRRRSCVLMYGPSPSQRTGRRDGEELLFTYCRYYYGLKRDKTPLQRHVVHLGHLHFTVCACVGIVP